jgi:formylglycine-generating enzyme required for sulfatase activity
LKKDWYKVWLAGEALSEAGIKRIRDSALGRDLLRRVRIRLADLITRGRLAPRERAAAGDVLANLGDPRDAVTSIDHMPFCYVPPGLFWMGSSDDDPAAADNEKPLHQVYLPYGFWLGRFPVTVAQFRIFVESAGHEPVDSD